LFDKYRAAGGGAGTYTRAAGGTTWTKQATAATAPAAAGTPGLEFTLINNNKEYSVKSGSALSGEVVIPATYNNLPVTRVGNFASAMIRSIIIPDSVTAIDNMAFTRCDLISVTIGGGVVNMTSTIFPAGTDFFNKYKAGGAGTYTRSGQTWTKK